MGIFNKIVGLAVQASHIRPVIGHIPVRQCSHLSNGIPVKLICNEMSAINTVKRHYAEKHIPFTDVDAGETLHNWAFIKKSKANVTEKDLLETMDRIRHEAFGGGVESRMQAHLRYT